MRDMVVEPAKTAPFGVALNTCGKCASRSNARRRPRFATIEHRSPSSRVVPLPCATTQAPEGTVHRYYDPQTGQFLTVDPLVAQTGQPFSYANDDPVNLSDPSGLAGGGPAAMCSGGEPVPKGETQAQACQAAEKAAWGYVPKPSGANPIVSFCGNGIIIEGCLTVVGTNTKNNVYLTGGVGIGVPGVSVSVAVPTTGSCNLVSGEGLQYGAQAGLGGGILSNPAGSQIVPFASIGTPGVEGFWTWGFPVAGNSKCCN